MYIYMGHMKYPHTKPYEDGFWEKNRIELKRAFVDQIDTTAKKVAFADGASLSYDILVIAAGSKSNKFGWPGQDLKGVQGLYSIQDVETMEMHTRGIQRAVIVGGGLIGVEMAEMLLSRHIPVTFLVREDSFWRMVLPQEEGAMIGRHLREHHADLRLQTELKEILPDANGQVRAVVTTAGEEIPCEFVGLTVGVSPNVDFLKNSNVELGKGVLVNEFLETNIPDVYAAGDCVEFRQPPPGRKKNRANLVHGPDAWRNAGANALRQTNSLPAGCVFQFGQVLRHRIPDVRNGQQPAGGRGKKLFIGNIPTDTKACESITQRITKQRLAGSMPLVSGCVTKYVNDG